jgi:hypothetical protein
VEPREGPAGGEVARRRERPRRVLDSSARTELLVTLVMLRSLLRPRATSWSVVGDGAMVTGSRDVAPVSIKTVMVSGGASTEGVESRQDPVV